MIPLQGTLEVVRLEGEQYKETTARGIIARNGQPIYVSNGVHYLRREVLVRTDTSIPRVATIRRQTSNFISSDIPEEIELCGGLDADGYFLTGILPWQGDWPSIGGINRIFDPGRFGMVPYMKKDESGMLIAAYGPVSPVQGYEDTLREQIRVVDPRRNSRAILVESEAQLEPLEDIIAKNELIAVRMEPLPQD
jgi:hypothetical protein|tara:strand:- start:286 stop:867 length:582 start_codon:yes stop_codon:yes gene_type:complete